MQLHLVWARAGADAAVATMVLALLAHVCNLPIADAGPLLDTCHVGYICADALARNELFQHSAQALTTVRFTMRSAKC